MTTQIVEAFLLIEQPRQRIGHWSQTLAALDAVNAPRVTGVVAYYDPTCDQALLDLQYETTTANMQYVHGVALFAEVVMVQPAELSEGERARFLAERLPRCTIRVTSQQTAVGALGELVRRIKEARGGRPIATTSKPPPIPAAARTQSTQPRGDTEDPLILNTAKGTRDNLRPYTEPPVQRGPEPPPPPRMGIETPPGAVRTVEPPTNPYMIDNPDRHRTVPMPLELSQRLTAVSSKLIDLDSLVPPTNPPVRHEETAQPHAPTTAEMPAANTIYARYLRGGRWVPVRVGALSLKGAALLSGALPRLHDRIDLALTFGALRAIVRGHVGKVSTNREAVASGASTFSVGFELDEGSRRQLTALLLAAREAKITIKPPPPRATRRFPVEWQVALGTLRGAVKATALDVSTFGMFVQTTAPLELGNQLTFSVVLDDSRSPIAGRARVVRKIAEAEAKSCGLSPGYGLVITSLSESDRMRWLGFLARIERRADKRVLIGAEPSRLAELQAGLASLGYAVTGGTDPGALVQLATADSRPADAVLIDAGWLQNEASASLVESLFSARNVPCVTMRGEARRARQAIDRLLEVVV